MTGVKSRSPGKKRKLNKEERLATEDLLREASLSGHANRVRRILRENAVDPECGRTDILRGKSEKTKLSPLILASWSGDVATVQVLIEAGADLRQCDPIKSRNILHWACKRGHFELTRFLVEKKGLDPRGADGQGRTPLMHASWWGHKKISKYLLSGPAGSTGHVNMTENTRGWTALLGACRYGQLEVAKSLLRNGANVSLSDKLGRPPILHVHESAVAEFLLANGADCMVKDPISGRTALHWASEDGNADLAHVIISHILNRLKDPSKLRQLISAIDKTTGCSPLLLAQRGGHKAIVSEIRGTHFHIYCQLPSL